MVKDVNCPKCGSNDIHKGRIAGNGVRMEPIGVFFSIGSEITADICCDCGHILCWQVTEPKKFKNAFKDY